MPATGNGQVNIKVGFTVDKTGLDDIQKALNNITKNSELDRLATNGEYTSETFKQAGVAAQELKNIVSTSWNSQLNQLDISKFQQQLDASGISLVDFRNNCYAMGSQGATAFNTLASSIFSTNVQIKESNKFLNSMADTLSKTIKWTGASSVIRKVTSSIREAWDFAKDLDESLNDIRIVTEKSADEMAEFAVQANNAAKALGVSTTDYTNASLIFYQQGLDDEEVQARTDVVAKVANVTGQAASEVADNLTAVWNGYQVTAEQAEESIDILAAVAANTASNLEELSTGMTKVAAAANEMGVGEAQLAAQISTIVSATRQAPETVGQALKTVYARMSTINAGGEDEDDGATLTSYSAKMQKFGIDVLDTNGHLRDMGDVIEEIGDKWENFSRETQISLAQAMAGTRQYVNVMALFENWDKYESTLAIAEDSVGTLETQQDIYMESTAAHLQELKTTAESMYNTLFDMDSINKLIDGLTKVVEMFGSLTSSFGGGMQSIANYGLMIANIFSNQIANGIGKAAANQSLMTSNTKQLQILTKQANELLSQQKPIIDKTTGSEQDYIQAVAKEAALKEQIQGFKDIEHLLPSLSNEDVNTLIDLDTQIAKVREELTLLQEQQKANTAAGDKGTLDSIETELAKQQDLSEERIRGRKELTYASTLIQDNAEKTAQETAEVEQGTDAQKEKTDALKQGADIAEDVLATVTEEKNIEEQEVDSTKVATQLKQEHRAAAHAAADAEHDQVEYTEDLVYLQKVALETQQQENETGQYLIGYEEQRLSVEKALTALQNDGIKLNKDEADAIKMALELSQKRYTTEGDLEHIEKDRKTLSEALLTAAGAENRLSKEHVQTSKDLEKAAKSTKDIEDQKIPTLQAILEKLLGQRDALEQQKSLAQELNGLIAGISSLLMNITQIRNAVQVISDDDLSNTEKLQQVLESLIMTVPMTITSVQRLTKSIQTFSQSSAVAAIGGMGVFTGYALAAAAAIAAVTVAVVQVVKYINRYKNAAKEAAETSKALAEANEELANSYDNLQSAIDTYDSAKEKLDECVKGTEEWKEALEETNDAALDLLNAIDSIPNISGDTIRNLYDSSTGEINQDLLNQINNQAQQQVRASELASAEGSYNASMVQTRSDTIDVLRKTAGNTGRSLDWLAKKVEENATAFVACNGDVTKAGEVLNSFGVYAQDIGNENFATLAESCLDLAEQFDAAAASLEVITQLEVDQILGDGYDQAIRQMTAGAVTAETKQIEQDIKDALQGNDINRWSDTGNDVYKDILSRLQQAGYDLSAASKNAVIGNDNNRALAFQNAEGERVEYGYQQIASMIAAAEALEQTGATAEEVQRAFDSLDTSLKPLGEELGNEVSLGLKDFITSGNIETMSQEAANALIDQIGENASAEEVAEWLRKSLGLDDIETLYNWLGEDIGETLLEAMNSYSIALESVGDNLNQAVSDAFTGLKDNGILNNASVALQKDIADTLSNIFEQGGQEALDQVAVFYQTLVDQGNSLEDFNDLINSLEWGTVSVEEFKNNLEDAGIEIDYDNVELDLLIGSLNGLAEAAKNTVASLEQLTSDTLSITDGLNRNDTISEDDYYTLLENLGDGIQSFFRRTITGEYKLIGAAEDFSNYVDNVLTNQFVQLAKEQENNANRFAEYFSYNSTEINEKGQEVEVGFNAEKVREGALQTYDDIIAYYGKEEIEIPIKTNVVDENGDIVDNITKPSKDAIEALNTLQTSQLSMVTIWQECVDVTNEEKEQLNAWNLELEQNGYLSEDSANALHDYVEEIYEGIDSEEEFNEKLQEMNDSYEQIYEQIAFSCDSLDELNEKLEQGQISVEAYNAAWGNLWETQREQDLDSDEIEEYSKYLSSLIKESDEYAKALEYNEKDQAKMNKYMQDAQKVCKQWAIEVLNMNDAIDDLSDNLEGYISCLQDSTASAQETSKAYNGLNEDLQKLLDVSTDFSTEFMVNNLDDLRLAAEGDEEAIDRLRDAALETIMVDIDMDISNFIDNATTFSDYLYSFRDVLDSYDWTVSPEFDTSSFEKGAEDYIEGLNELMDAGAITSQQVQDSLRLMGYDVEWTDEEYPVEETYPVTTTLHEVINYKQVPYQQQIGTEIIPSASGNTDDFKTVPIYSTMYLPTWTTKETPSTDYVTADGLDTEFAAEVTTGDGKSYGGGLTTKHIAGITKHASSSMNNKSSVNAGSLTPSTSSSSSPKSSSGSTSEPKQEDHIEDQSDRYHDINLRLQDISTSLARIQRQESKLLGQALIDNLNAQLATLDDYIDATTVKIEIATQEAAELRAELSSQGVTFDSNGYISNYQAAMDAQLATVNAVIDKYNGMSAEEQEAYEDTLQNAKDAYNDFVEALNNYDTLIHETIPGLEDDITDALDQEIQINISKFTMAVEIRLDMDQAEKDWNEFYRKVILGLSDSDLIGQALQNVLDYQSYFDTGAGTGVVQSLTDQINATLDQLHQYDESGWMSAYGDDYAQAFEDLQTYQSELMEILEDIEDIPYEMWEYYTQAIEEATDAVNDHMKAYEDMQSVLDHQLNLIEILYGDEAYDYINGVYDQMLEYDERQLAEYRNQMDMYQGYMNQAYEKMQEALAEGDEEAYKQWYEVYSMWYDAYYDAADSLLTVLEDSFEIAIKEYENSLNQITNDFNQELFGTDLDWASTMWDLQNQYADMYLDTINAMYEVEKLQQKYLDAIDATDSIKGQQELNALMEDQIGYLQEKDKLTQYDIDHAELEYEIALKRIALEEAQQEKSSMRLRRDSQGNYTYQYVTDEDEISNLRSQLLDLEQQLYNLDVNQYKQNISDLLSTIQDFEEQYIEIMTDLTLTDEERQDRLEELYEMYAMLIYGYAEQVETSEINLVQDTFGALEEMYAQDPEMYNAMLKDELEYLRIEEDDIKGTYKERQEQFRQMYGNIYGYAEDAEGNIQYVGKETADAMTKIAMKEDETLQDTISKITNGITNNYIQPVADAIYEAGQEAEDDTNSFMDNALKAFETIFGDFIQEGWDAEQEAEKAIEDLEKAAGYTTDDIINGFEDVMEQVEQNIDVTEEYTEAMWEQLDAIIELCEWLERMVKDYESIVDAAKEAIQASEDYVKSVQEQNAQAAEAEQQNMTGGGSSSSSSSSSSGSSSSSSSSSGTSLKVGSKVTLKKGTQWYWDSWGKDPHGSPTTSEQTVYITRVSPYSDSTKKYHMSSGLGDKKTYKSGEVVYLGNGDLGWVTQTDIKGYKTGGYTGDWNGDEGQLALLHQKELVLNQQDTQNLLAAVNVVRDVADLLSNLDTDVLTHMHDMMFLTKLQNTDYDSANDLLEQDVHIEANFPNVTNSNEIEQAFNNLVNVASQHANRAKVRR